MVEKLKVESRKRKAETGRLILALCGSCRRGRVRGFEPDDGFAGFHHIKAITGDCFQVSRIVLEQFCFLGLAGKHHLFLGDGRLQLFDASRFLTVLLEDWSECQRSPTQNATMMAPIMKRLSAFQTPPARLLSRSP